ncbi:hypothetical protein OKW41_000336 [Paraburkholderia sp. UCT70]
MPVWKAAPLAEKPNIMLSDWCVFEIDAGTRHLVGYNTDNGHGRVSSPIETVDYPSLRARTRSGRVYELQGPTGLPPVACYTWHRWCQLHDVLWYVDVSSQFRNGGCHDDA